DDLENRARRVLALESPVHERCLGVAHEPSPFLAVEVPGELVEAERRTRRHRQYVAVARMHHDARAGMALHGALSRFLDASVDARDHLTTGIRLFAPHDLNGPAQRVDLDALASVRPAQVLVQEAFKTGLADQVATPVSPLFHLLLVHLANVAEQV